MRSFYLEQVHDQLVHRHGPQSSLEEESLEAELVHGADREQGQQQPGQPHLARGLVTLSGNNKTLERCLIKM